MAKIHIREYEKQAVDAWGNDVAVGEEPALATQSLDITSSVVTSAAFNARTRFIRIHNDSICQIDVGSSPSPSQGGAGRLPADTIEYLGVQVGQSHKLAVIEDT